MNASAERGGVSRPSSSAWTRTAGTPCRAASSTSATRCRSLAWTPPGPMRLTRWSRPSGRAARAHASSSAGRSKNEPSAMAASIRGRSCSTGRPAPRLRWPTSELPIWPAGSPTASSEARSVACGQSRHSPRQVGIRAAAIASDCRIGADPEPIEHDQHDRARARPGASVTRRRGRRPSVRPVPRSLPSRRA